MGVPYSIKKALSSCDSAFFICQGLIFLLYFIILDTRRNPTVYVNGLDVLNQHFLHWEFGLYIVRQCLHWTVDPYRRTPTCLGRLKTRFINGMVGLFSYSRI